MHLKQFERALEAFEHSNSISRHDSTYLHMGKVTASRFASESVASANDITTLVYRTPHPVGRKLVPLKVYRRGVDVESRNPSRLVVDMPKDPHPWQHLQGVWNFLLLFYWRCCRWVSS